MLLLLVIPLIAYVEADCNNNVKCVSSLDMNSVYGMWVGVGYVQHLPDWTDLPERVGCVVLHISDVTHELQPDWLGDNTVIRHNYTNRNWRSPKTNPWSDTPLSGSWLDVPFKHIAKRDLGSARQLEIEKGGKLKREVRPGEVGRVRVLWDEDGHSQEQTYTYHVTVPGAWSRGGRGARGRGTDDDTPPPRVEYINVVHSTPHMLILNYCSERGSSRHFSLVLRRSAVALQAWNWQAVKRTLLQYNARHMYRLAAVCAGEKRASAVGVLVASLLWLELS